MDQLKKALLKAGFESTQQQKVQERQPKKPLKLSKEDEGHSIRVQCEVCGGFANDIEFYNHSDRRIEHKKWLCIKCADDHQILDDTRQTHQSPYARSGRFRRQHGRTRNI